MAKIRIDNLRMARRFLVKLMNETYEDVIPENKARTLSTLINSFIKCYEISEIENRLNLIQSNLEKLSNPDSSNQMY